jgi:hypothetical protein
VSAPADFEKIAETVIGGVRDRRSEGARTRRFDRDETQILGAQDVS